MSLLLLAATAAVAVAAALCIWMQRRRLAALAGRDAARSASETNRLLMSLLAHDLRAPLTLAEQGFQYIDDSLGAGYPVDRVLIADVRARLQRSLRAIEMVLSIASTDADPQGRGQNAAIAVDLADEIGAEVDGFRYEADARGKRLVAELEAVRHTRARTDVLVLRQALAIALDNAVRYADPGPVHVHASVERSTLHVRITDSGPGLSAHRAHPSHAGGSGLGLRLCGTLLARGGGDLRTERDAPDGTTVLIRLPVAVVSAAPFAEPTPLLAAV